MKTIKSDTVEFVVLEEGERLRQGMLLPRSGTGWQGQLFLETIKANNSFWATGEMSANGSPLFRMPSVDEVVSRAVAVVEQAESTLKARGWSVAMMSAAELLDEGGRPGFVVNSPHGKADPASPPLPAAKRPA